MKGFLALLVLVVIGGAGWYFYQVGTPAVPAIPAAEFGDVMMKDHVMEDGTMMDSAMPTMEDGTIAEKEVMMDEMMDGKGMMGEKTGTKTFNMTGKMFAFSETEMRVKKGDKVTVNFESTEGLHDWVVDEFNARTKQVQPGTKTSVTFTADKTGTFEYYCAVGKHRQMGMVGKLIVE